MLNNTQIKNAKPQEKQYRLSDGNNLYLEIPPKGPNGGASATLR